MDLSDETAGNEQFFGLQGDFDPEEENNPLSLYPVTKDSGKSRIYCIYKIPYSGRYYGPAVEPATSNLELELRVDISSRYSNSPVMNRVSGDIFRVYKICLPGKKCRIWRVYVESFIVDKPVASRPNCKYVVKGDVRYWKGTHPQTTIEITLPSRMPLVIDISKAITPADVILQTSSGQRTRFTCAYVSDCFREINVEVDVCNSANKEPILPTYNTYWAPATDRPPSLTSRSMTFDSAYREAGVCVGIRQTERTIIDDHAPEFTKWTDRELHDAMESHFSQFSGGWPRWEMWGLMAGGLYETNSGVVGIMFDYSGAGKPPERQGFAVFKNHSVFNNLVAGTPTTTAQAQAIRYFLYCYVHEAGHAFNLVHSWNKGRPDALSWMNYPQYVTGFWKNFMLRFDDEELIHIRHGDRASVIMGGDPWASGMHLETPGALDSMEGEPPLELLIRSKEYFDLMEPVIIELRLRNLMDIPIGIETKIKPEFGTTSLYIQKPDGTTVMYHPPSCLLANPDIGILKPEGEGVAGEDRYSDTIFMSYGSDGFYFNEPGEYRIRAQYNGTGDITIISNVHRIRIGSPATKDEAKRAHAFFSYPVGMALYLHGSPSPFLKEGMTVLESMARKAQDTLVGARIAARIAPGIAQPFHRIENNTMTMVYPGEPETALEITRPAVEVFRNLKGNEAKALNISYNKLVSKRALVLKGLGKKSAAKKEMAALRSELGDRGVNESVLEAIRDFEGTL